MERRRELELLLRTNRKLLDKQAADIRNALAHLESVVFHRRTLAGQENTRLVSRGRFVVRGGLRIAAKRDDPADLIMPEIGLKLVPFIVPKRRRADVIGDLDEDFRTYAAQWGRPYALRLFWWEIAELCNPPLRSHSHRHGHWHVVSAGSGGSPQPPRPVSRQPAPKTLGDDQQIGGMLPGRKSEGFAAFSGWVTGQPQ